MTDAEVEAVARTLEQNDLCCLSEEGIEHLCGGKRHKQRWGIVTRVRSDGLVVVVWIGNKSPSNPYHPSFLRLSSAADLAALGAARRTEG